MLSDPERRKQYDRFGHAGVRNGAGQGAGGFEGFDIFGGFGDIFDAFFGSGTASRTRPASGRRRAREHQRHIRGGGIRRRARGRDQPHRAVPVVQGLTR